MKKLKNLKTNSVMDPKRAMFIVGLFSIAFAVIVIRLFDLVISYDPIEKKYDHSFAKKTFMRANITDANGILLATNLRTASLYANSKKIREPKIAARKLSKLIKDLKYKDILLKLQSQKSFIWIKRNLTPKQQYEVNKLGIVGLNFKFEEKRVYPHSNLFSHILGYVGIDGMGLAGFEKEWNDQIVSGKEDIQLSVDSRIQNIMKEEISKTIKSHEAEGAVGILMNAESGKIISMMSLPDFDPHIPAKAKFKQKFNKATQGVYEMGSTLKPFTISMAIEAKIADLNDVYYVGSPIRASRRFMISDMHDRGKWLSVPEIFLYSSNVGMSKIALEIGGPLQREYLENFGFLNDLSLEINEKATPIFPKTKNWSEISTMTISYGYGIAITPMHLLKAFAALNNGGKMPNVSLLKNSKIITKEVISQETSEKMKKLFRLVVKKGTGRKINANSYVIGGKTGTANKSANGSYDKSSRLTTFLSSFPLDNPEYVMLIMMDNPKPQKGNYGYATAAYNAVPVSGRIIKKIAPLLSIAKHGREVLLDEELTFEHSKKDKSL